MAFWSRLIPVAERPAEVEMQVGVFVGWEGLDEGCERPSWHSAQSPFIPGVRNAGAVATWVRAKHVCVLRRQTTAALLPHPLSPSLQEDLLPRAARLRAAGGDASAAQDEDDRAKRAQQRAQVGLSFFRAVRPPEYLAVYC